MKTLFRTFLLFQIILFLYSFQLSAQKLDPINNINPLENITTGENLWNLSVSGSTSTFNSLAFRNSLYGIAVGSSGTILITSNGGANWFPVSSGTSNELISICYQDSIFWSVGANGTILKSTNYGYEWKAQLSNVTQSLLSVQFINHNEGFVVGGNGKILKTTDGGDTWIGIASPTTLTLRGLSFSDQNIGYAVGGDFTPGQGIIINTTDKGQTWNIKVLATGYLFTAVHSPDVNTIYVVGAYPGFGGSLIKSSNAGLSWYEYGYGDNNWLYAVHFLDANNGWIAGGSVYTGLIMRTSNGGSTWSYELSNTGQWIYAFTAIDLNNAWAGGYNGKLYYRASAHLNIISPNGGENWKVGDVDTIRWINNGVTNVKIEFTTNNGTTWSTIIASAPAVTGFYNWIVPNTPSTNCKVKISDANDATNYSISNSVFTISSQSQNSWQAVITVKDNGNTSQSLSFGQSPLATDGIDVILGEAPLPPFPPTGIFDSRFELPVTPIDFSLKDFRLDTLKTISWIIRFQPGIGGYPITFTWNQLSLPEGAFYLKDMVTGSIINVNMKTSNSLILSNTGITSLKIEYSRLTCSNVNLNSGWNMISVPVTLPNMNTGSLFPDYSSPTYAYNNGYQVVTTLGNGSGYWIRYNSTKVINLCGSKVSLTTIPVSAGWNIIGGYDSDIPVSSITTTPPSILISPFFGFNNSYIQATSLQVGKGYWINASQSGVINIQNSQLKNDFTYSISSFIDPSWGRLVISDMNGNQGVLYEANGKITLSDYDLPPVPPAGIFDIRYGSNRNVEVLKASQEIKISSAAYPITLRSEGTELRIRDNYTGKIIDKKLTNGESLIISNNAINSLMIEQAEVPVDYYLDQNYPNPFNPSTTISFGIPEKANVRISIYNQLGELVSVILNKVMDPGHHNIIWNAGNMSSGVYFYEMNAGKSMLVKKLLLMK